LFAALGDPTGMTALRLGAFERIGFLLADWRHTKLRLADVEQRTTGVLDQLQLTELVTSIPGLSPVGAAAILAETGDPRRFATARAMVKHAGLAPREKLSGSFVGRIKLTGQGRPLLRLAAWRAVWGALKANPVYPARHRHLTGREHNPAHRGAGACRREDQLPEASWNTKRVLSRPSTYHRLPRRTSSAVSYSSPQRSGRRFVLEAGVEGGVADHACPVCPAGRAGGGSGTRSLGRPDHLPTRRHLPAPGPRTTSPTR
jgi:Transposase IS116/IS110/IS902 family